MGQDIIAKYHITYHKSIIDNAYDALALLQEQSERLATAWTVDSDR